MSVPIVSVSPGTTTVYPTTTTTVYPALYPSSTVISASALTSFSSPVIPISTIPSVSTFLTNTVMTPIYPSVVTYQDVNSDPDLRSKVTEQLYSKVINSWLKYQYLDIYQMFSVSNNKVSLVSDIKQAEANTKQSDSDLNLIYQHLVSNYVSKNDVYKLLDKFRKINNLNWWDLKHHSDKVRKYIHHKIFKYVKSEVLTKHKA